MVPAVLNSNNMKNEHSTTGPRLILFDQNMQLLSYKL